MNMRKNCLLIICIFLHLAGWTGVVPVQVNEPGSGNAEFAYPLLSAGIFLPQNHKTIDEIETLSNEIHASERYIDRLDSGAFFNLPIGLTSGSNEDPAYTILISSMTLTPGGAYFDAFMMFKNPVDGKPVAFEALNVPFSFRGGLQGIVRMELVSEVAIKATREIDIKILPGTFVEFGCGGFQQMGLFGNLLFENSTFIKVDSKGNDLNEPLQAFFETTAKSFSDLTFSLSLDRFRLKCLPHLYFTCKDLTADFSDNMNPPAIVFPDNYAMTVTGADEMWKGIYIGQAAVTLGGPFSQEDKEELTLSAYSLLIDENGFTGTFGVENLASMGALNMDGWPFSINDFQIDFINSHISSGMFSGKLNVPFFGDENQLNYKALISSGGEYFFTVKPENNLQFPAFGNSSLELANTSVIEVSIIDDKFIPEANLNGRLNLNCPISDGDKGLNFKGMAFQGMRLATVEPLMTIDYLAYSGDEKGKFSGFPITIKSLELINREDDYVLNIHSVVNFSKSSEEGFGGESLIGIVSQKDNNKLKYKSAEIGMIKVSFSKPKAFSIEGEIAFAKGDAVYGNGFRGYLHATFTERFEVEALAVFGSINNSRYFFVDAAFMADPGIKAGPINFNGFMGGLYKHMSQKVGNNSGSQSFGKSLSGITYLPDPNIGIGIKAGVKFGLISKQLIDADACFEIVFEKSGGLKQILFTGNAKCITPEVPFNASQATDKLLKMVSKGREINVPAGLVTATIDLEMNFDKEDFHGELVTYINVGSFIRGVNPGGMAGKSVIHFDHEKWYLHIGSPQYPLGIEYAGIMRTGTYFMAGHDLPTTLPTNEKILSHMSFSEDDFCKQRNSNILEGGKGFAFGTNFELSTGDLTFLIFYGSFEIGAGFDMMLLDYGSKAYCDGFSPPVGINGWYADGQAYAYLAGKIGLTAKLLGKQKKFEILSISSGALLNLQGPNPFYMQGFVSGKYNILNGIISGTCRFKVEAGEKCEIMTGNDDVEMEIIGDITPSDQASDVDVFALPQVVFNLPVEKEIKLSEGNLPGKYYKIKLEEFNIVGGQSSLSGNYRWNERKDVLVLELNSILHPENEYEIKVKVSFQEKINGEWVPFKEDGKILSETRKLSFKTGKLPGKIPAGEVLHSYPVNRQMNFYKDEYKNGYIIFRRDLSPFFEQIPDYRKEVWLSTGNSRPLVTKMDYISSENRLDFSLPEGIMLNKIYSCELMNVPTSAAKRIDRNVETKIESRKLNDSTSIDIKGSVASGEVRSLEEKSFFSIKFRTSMYSSLKSKIGVTEKEVRSLYRVAENVYFMGIVFTGDEMFDKYEIYGSENSESLIKGIPLPLESKFYSKEVHPLLYKVYPWGNTSQCMDWRDPDEPGIPPLENIKIWQTNCNRVLKDSEIKSGSPEPGATLVNLVYTLPYFWAYDYYDMRDYLLNYPPSYMMKPATVDFIKDNFWLRPVKADKYPVKIEYHLPGRDIVTSSFKLTFNNKLKTTYEDFKE